MSRESNALTQFNILMHNYEWFNKAISTDYTVRNKYIIEKCDITIMLYAYLFKHKELIADLFEADECGVFNIYKSYNILEKLVYIMESKKCTPLQAIKELR